MNKSEADILDGDMVSDMAWQRMRRWAMIDGDHKRAVLVDALPGCKVPNWRSIETVRAEQLKDLEDNGLNQDKLIFTNGDYVVVLDEDEGVPVGFTHVGSWCELSSWLALAVLVAESRGMLADGVRLRGSPGEYLGERS